MIPLPAMFRKEKPTIAMLLVVKDCQQQEYDYEKSKPQTKTESKTPYNTIKTEWITKESDSSSIFTFKIYISAFLRALVMLVSLVFLSDGVILPASYTMLKNKTWEPIC